LSKKGADHVALGGERGFEPAGAGVEQRIVAQILDPRAGVADGRAIARESLGAGRKTRAERDMAEIDGELTGAATGARERRGERRSAKGAPCAAAAAAALSPGMKEQLSNIEISSLGESQTVSWNIIPIIYLTKRGQVHRVGHIPSWSCVPPTFLN
jgi:hypothetical protein